MGQCRYFIVYYPSLLFTHCTNMLRIIVETNLFTHSKMKKKQILNYSRKHIMHNKLDKHVVFFHNVIYVQNCYFLINVIQICFQNIVYRYSPSVIHIYLRSDCNSLINVIYTKYYIVSHIHIIVRVIHNETIPVILNGN